MARDRIMMDHICTDCPPPLRLSIESLFVSMLGDFSGQKFTKKLKKKKKDASRCKTSTFFDSTLEELVLVPSRSCVAILSLTLSS